MAFLIGGGHSEALYYPFSFFKISLKELFYSNYLKLSDTSIAYRLANIDFEEAKKLIDENLAKFDDIEDDTTDDTQAQDEALKKMLELQELMKG